MGEELRVGEDNFFKVIDKNSLVNLTPQEKAYAALKASGLEKAEIAKVLGIKKKSKDSRVSQLERSVKTKSIVNPKMVKLAHKAVEETLEMQPVTVTEVMTDKDGEQKTIEKKLYPSHSNRLDAAKMILNRSEPEVQKHLNVNVDGKDIQNLVDLSHYSEPEKEEVIEVDVTETSQNNDVSRVDEA